MSQISKPGSGGGGPIPPTVPEQFVTDDGTAIPAANSLNVRGGESSIDDDNGILTQANPDMGDNLDIILTNRLSGAAVSTNASVEDLITFALAATDACYRFEFAITGRDTATGDGVGYTMFASAKTDGATATVVATPFVDNDEDASLIAAQVSFVASTNSVILQVTGVAAQTITYKAVGSYVVV